MVLPFRFARGDKPGESKTMATANALPTAAQSAAACCNPTRPREQGLWLNTVSARRPGRGSARTVVANPQTEQLDVPAAIVGLGRCTAQNWVQGIAADAFLEAGPARPDLWSAIATRSGLASRRRITYHGRRRG
jgi:hypothetical protein